MAYRPAIARQVCEPSDRPRLFSISNTASTFSLPCADQTGDSIERWLTEDAGAGMVVVVRHATWQLYEYHLDQIVRINAQTGRVHLAQHGSFDSRGRAVSAPKNVLTLLEPTPPVLMAAVAGRTWQHGRPAFKRPLAACEMRLLDLLQNEIDARPAAEAV